MDDKEKFSVLLQNIDKMPSAKMPLIVCGLAMSVVKDVNDVRIERMFNQVSTYMKMASGFSQSMFSLTYLILHKEEPFSVIGFKEPPTPESLTMALMDSALASKTLMTEGLITKDELTDYFENLYELGYQIMFPESSHPERNHLVADKLSLFGEMIELIDDDGFFEQNERAFH